jgi:hypothetical protein
MWQGHSQLASSLTAQGDKADDLYDSPKHST